MQGNEARGQMDNFAAHFLQMGQQRRLFGTFHRAQNDEGPIKSRTQLPLRPRGRSGAGLFIRHGCRAHGRSQVGGRDPGFSHGVAQSVLRADEPGATMNHGSDETAAGHQFRQPQRFSRRALLRQPDEKKQGGRNGHAWPVIGAQVPPDPAA